ncbi:MAG: hypothetical protein GWP03_03370, partial [Proteobacteria bacterium]|nr:hypothetical protein [Pseudomonadota bacterium]
MFKRWTSRFMIIAMVAVILSSCTKKETEKTVIKVGDITVSNQLFEKIKNRRYNKYKTNKEVAEEMENTILVGLAAKDKGYGDSIKIILNNRKMDILSNALYEKLILQGTKVSDKEIKAEYNKILYKYNVNQIVTKNKSTIDSAYAELKSGKNFADVCKNYTEEQTRKNNGGSIGQVVAERYREPFQSILLHAKIGQYTKSFEYGKRWYIILVTDKVKNNLPKFDEMKDNIANKMLRAKRYKKASAYIKKLEKKGHLVFNDSTIKKISDVFGTAPGTMIDTTKITDDMKKLVVATSSLKKWTVEDLIALEGERGVRLQSNPFAIKQLLERITLGDMLNNEARKRGLDKTNIVKEQNEYAKYELLANELRKTFKYTPTDQEIKKYYKKNKKDFYNKTKADVRVIVLNDENTAKDLVKKLTPANFVKFVKKDSKDFSRNNDGLIKRYNGDFRKDLNLGNLPIKARLGKIMGPVKGSGNKWVIYMVEKKYPGSYKSFNDVQGAVRYKIQNEKRKEMED